MHPFQRTKLQELCSQFFGWPPEKTDEYILPKIAERELRKFANLRLSSSQLGVALPLHSIPVKCPISEVLKHRRLQGRECFEVSWEEFDGLNTSIVPADLIESACPEKITEFEERKAQIKKQNRRKARPKKSDDTASMVNVDAKLQSLLLDIESEDSARFKPTSRHNACQPKKSEDLTSRGGQRADSGSAHLAGGLCVELPTHQPSSIASVNLRTESPLLDLESEDNARSIEVDLNSCYSSSASGSSIEVDLTISDNEDYESNIYHKPSVDCQSDLPISMETDFIDLLSPSPVLNTRYVSKCQGNIEQLNVIDLSDSDMEISPDHAKKARELRLFLTSIREEIS